MISTLTAWLAVRLPATAQQILAGPTPTPSNGPGGFDWDRVRPDQFDTIPFLAELRDRMLARRRHG